MARTPCNLSRRIHHRSGDDGGHFTVCNGSNNDGIGCIVVCNEDVLLVFEQHGEEATSEFGIHCSIDLVGQCSPAVDMVYIIDFMCQEEIFGERGWDMFDFCFWWDGHIRWCWKFYGLLLGVGGSDDGRSFLYMAFGSGRG